MANVIDASCWRDFVDEWVAKTDGDGTELFKKAQKNGGVCVDAGKLVKQEYISLKRPYAEQLYDIWFENAWSAGEVKLVNLAGKANLRKELLGLGVPQKDHLFFRVAVHGNAGYIVSKDSDFFDPSKKLAGEAHKAKIVSEGKGPVCKHMRKVYGVLICCPNEYLKAA